MILTQHLPARQPRIHFLVRVFLIIELGYGAEIISHELLVGIGCLLISVVMLVVNLLLFRSVGLQACIPAANADLQTLLDSVLFRFIQVFGTFFLRVCGITPPHEREDHACADQTVGEIVYQVVLDLYFGRAVPALAVDQLEHVPYAIDEQVGRLEPVVSVTDDATARHIVGVVSLDARAVGHLARQVSVIKRDLRERPDRRLAVVVRAVLVVEIPGAIVQLRAQGAVLRVVEVIGDGRFAQGERFAVLVRELLRVEELASFGVVDVQLAAHESVVHLGYRRVERPLRQAVEREDQPLDAVADFARVLILETSGYETGVTHAAEFGNLLSETQSALGQGVPVLQFEIGYGCRHLIPFYSAVLLRLPQCGGGVHEPKYRLDDRGVGTVLGNLCSRQRITVVETEA